MKNLLTKTTKPFLIYVLIVFAVSIPVYYVVVDTIWLSELDEHNELIAEKSAFELNKLSSSDIELEKSIALWNKIQHGTDIQKIPFNTLKSDKKYTVERKINVNDKEPERFRCLKTVVYIHKQPYLFTIETNVEETKETVISLAITTIFLFLIMVVGLLALNRRLSNTVWQPFNDTLNKLKSFNLNDQANISFDKTDIKEFEELNLALSKLIDHNISVYKTQKEFTENASHELQTPLAILQNKLDLLLQDEDITERQYKIIEELNKTLTRSSRINKNLLLLAKIENQQFAQDENLFLNEMLSQSIDVFKEHFEQKDMSLQQNIQDEVKVFGNKNLTETLLNNLFVNTIRHTPISGEVHIKLTKNRLEISNSGKSSLSGENLFKRFSKSSTDSNGSGLGLAIIKEICNRQHWKISYHFENNLHFFTITF
ncbi:HAMP domain-containing sensor histidine kinase [Chryseobacterium sp. MYb264]|uniref:sensor histidine kinase n=1 Tax=Chryseobacterium sp. MYb264 TaxID=2745153 RepID=UPI002E0F660B|nr:HAMP domain-containing sensor histidine kinase [Chryseobacterium sp. MYb264]